MSAKVKMWVIRNVLNCGLPSEPTEGILVNSGSVFLCKTLGGLTDEIHEGEFFATREEAVIEAESARKREILKLERQISKLRSKTFE